MVKRAIAIYSILIINTGIFAQSEGTFDQAITDDDNVPAISETQSDSTNDGRSQAIEKRYGEYCLWFAINVFPLSKVAEKNGIQATQEEISVQEKAFEAMFPGIPSAQDDRCNEILARKYSKTIPGTFISTGNIQNAYTQLQSELSNEPMPSFADVQPMLEMMTLVENRSVQIEVEKYEEQKQKECIETQKKLSETWPISDLMIHASDNNCLAQYKDDDSCVLTVEKFNQYIRYMEVPKFFSLDKARMSAIREILRDLYLADEARNQQSEGSDTIMAQARQSWIQGRMLRMKCQTIGEPVRDSNSLHDTYSKYYDALFSERVFPYFSIIGSSDSLYMDSISRALKCGPLKNDKNGDAPSDTMHSSSRFPWSYSRADFLPEEFDKYIDTMHIKDVSRVIKMPYGFFIVRFDSMQIRPALRFEDAQDDLIFLATKRKWENLDSLLEAEAYRIYTSNKRLNRTPDTLRVISFLTPLNDGAPPISPPGKSSKKSPNKGSLKGLQKGLAVVSTQLPFDIHDSLLNRFEASKDNEQVLGPVASRYGVWNFTVLEIHRGGMILPFSLSKKRLIDSMVVREREFTFDASWQKPDSVLDNIALAKSCSPAFFGIHHLRREVRNNPAERDSRRQAMMNARKHSFSRGNKVDELEEWFSKLSILYNTDHQEKSTYFQGEDQGGAFQE